MQEGGRTEAEDVVAGVCCTSIGGGAERAVSKALCAKAVEASLQEL